MVKYIADEKELFAVLSEVCRKYLETHERVVRCSDCEHYKYVDEVCSRFDGIYLETNPDGFCAWGEPNEVS